MTLSDPRTIDYAFEVFTADGWVWLFDDSERTYLCSPRAYVWAEPLYSQGDGDADYPDGVDADYPDGAYFLAIGVERRAVEVLTIDHTEETEATAWDDAREEANANHRL
jgi:hypothetical protein